MTNMRDRGDINNYVYSARVKERDAILRTKYKMQIHKK